MAMKQCANGHLYDDSKSPDCPYCSGANSIGKTIPLNQPSGSAALGSFSATEVLKGVPTVSVPQDMGVTQAPVNAQKDQVKTQIVEPDRNSEIIPVRGWLIVIDGEKLGMDFRVHNGFNKIGRSKSNDICFDFDNAVSKENNASIVYDDRDSIFYITRGEGSSNLVRVNGAPLLESKILNDYDIIEIGKTKLVFRSLCNDKFHY